MRVEVKARDSGTIVNLAVFQRLRYYLDYSDELAEYARSIHVYLSDILSRSATATTPQVKLNVTQPSTKDTSFLVDSIIDDLQGWWVETQKLNKMGWAKIALFIIAVGIVGLFLFQFKDYASGYATLALILLYIIFELPSRFRKESSFS